SLTPTAGPDAVSWSATKGTITPSTTVGDTPPAQWAIPKDVATHVPETLTVSAALSSKSHCPTVTLALDVKVDWPDNLRTLVVFDSARTGSKDVADAYATYRAIPADHMCPVTTSNDTSIPTAEYAT